MRKIIALIVCTLFFAGSTNAGMVITDSIEIDSEVGDFIQYEFVDDSFIVNLGKAMGEDKYLRYEDHQGGKVRMELTTKGETLYEGETVNFIAGEFSWDESFVLFFDDISDDGDGKEDRVEVHYSMISETWDIDASFFSTNNTVIKDSTFMKINFNMTINQYEDQILIWSSSIQETTTDFIDREGIEPSTLEVGTTWSITTTDREKGTERSRDCVDGDCDDWVTEEIDEELTVTTNYEIIGEKSLTTPAGNFNVLEQKETESGEDPGNYTLTYLSEMALPVGLTVYEEDAKFMNLHLESYKISGLGTLNLEDLDEDENPLTSLPILLSLVAIALVASRTRKD